MDFTTQFFFFLLFAIVGFITEKAIGLNIYKVYSDTASAIFIISIYTILFPVMATPENISSEDLVFRIRVVTENLVNALPAMVLGDVAGSIVANITGDSR